MYVCECTCNYGKGQEIHVSFDVHAVKPVTNPFSGF